ncbi:MAG: OmpA family protein [Cytophagaceae bacterium]|nr:OmpA family protein [Cytophagaceae bacterium]
MKKNTLFALALTLGTSTSFAQLVDKPKEKIRTVDPKNASEDISRQSTENPANSDAKVKATDSTDAPAVNEAMDIMRRNFSEGRYVSYALFFDSAQASINPASMEEIRGLARVINQTPDTKYEIGVHTDTEGDEVSNLRLSQARAEVIKARLVAGGVAPERLSVKGYGKTKPIAVGTAPASKADNQRVEFVKL